MSLLCPYKQRINYIVKNLNYCLPQSHCLISNIRGDLGIFMESLKSSKHGSIQAQQSLRLIFSCLQLDINYDEFLHQYNNYLKILNIRDRQIASTQTSNCICVQKKTPVPTLTSYNWNMWGSQHQIWSGKLIIDALNLHYNINLHPMWGAMLSPTSGLTGAGNNILYTPTITSVIGIHSIIHDASGYLKLYHNIGPGYNYLETYMTLFPTTSPMSCQISGIYFWWKHLYIVRCQRNIPIPKIASDWEN